MDTSHSRSYGNGVSVEPSLSLLHNFQQYVTIYSGNHNSARYSTIAYCVQPIRKKFTILLQSLQ